MKWISVKDRLPEVGQSCVVARRISAERWWFACSEYYDYGFPFVAVDDPNPITHWMPLPPPPSEEQ